jgi:ATP-dependent DNA helicase RecG
VLNAVVHRNYFVRQSVLVEVRRDRVVVSSPGGFIGGVSPNNVLRHPPVRRNPRLAETLQALGYVNRVGMGVDRICEEHLRLGKPVPLWEADESHVKLALSRVTHPPFARFVAEERRAGRSLELNDLLVLRGVTERGELDRWTAAKRLQLSHDEAAAILASLRGKGYLAPHGRGPGTRYRLARGYAEALRGPAESARDLPLDHEAVRLRVQALLGERGRLTNDDVRRLSDYSRTQVLRLMRALRTEGLAEVVGRGRAAHYVPGPKLRRATKPKGRR